MQIPQLLIFFLARKAQLHLWLLIQLIVAICLFHMPSQSWPACLQAIQILHRTGQLRQCIAYSVELKNILRRHVKEKRLSGWSWWWRGIGLCSYAWSYTHTHTDAHTHTHPHVHMQMLPHTQWAGLKYCMKLWKGAHTIWVYRGYFMDCIFSLRTLQLAHMLSPYHAITSKFQTLIQGLKVLAVLLHGMMGSYWPSHANVFIYFKGNTMWKLVPGISWKASHC